MVLNLLVVFLCDYIGIDFYNMVVFIFVDYLFNLIGVIYMIFLLVFVIGYCVVVEIFLKIKFW